MYGLDENEGVLKREIAKGKGDWKTARRFRPFCSNFEAGKDRQPLEFLETRKKRIAITKDVVLLDIKRNSVTMQSLWQ